MKGGTPANYRFSVRTLDIDPRYNSQMVSRGGPVDSISLYITGRKTDWLNCGNVRKHGKLPDDHPNTHTGLVRNFTNRYQLIPENPEGEMRKTFERCGNGILTTDIQATETIRTEVRLNGLSPDQYALHSLRIGGATALYRATGDLDLVARYGRWKGTAYKDIFGNPT